MIYLMQHALALSKEQDPERGLSPEGIAQSEAMAGFLAGTGIRPQAICHSGKRRAEQTAAIMAARLNPCTICAIEAMAPNDPPRLLAERLQDNSLYIGHLPHLDRLVSLLLCGDESRQLVQMQNSGILCLHPADSGYRLAGYLHPALLPAAPLPATG